MAARMKIIEIAGQRLHTAKIIRHGLQREFTHARIRRAGVERIGRMGKDRPKPMRRHQRPQGLRIGQIQGLCLAAARIAGEKLKCIRPNVQGVAA